MTGDEYRAEVASLVAETRRWSRRYPTVSAAMDQYTASLRDTLDQAGINAAEPREASAFLFGVGLRLSDRDAKLAMLAAATMIGDTP